MIETTVQIPADGQSVQPTKQQGIRPRAGCRSHSIRGTSVSALIRQADARSPDGPELPEMKDRFRPRAGFRCQRCPTGSVGVHGGVLPGESRRTVRESGGEVPGKQDAPGVGRCYYVLYEHT